MILGELGGLAVAGEIHAAIANLRDIGGVRADEQGRQRARHALLPRIELAHTEDHVTRGLDRAFQQTAHHSGILGRRIRDMGDQGLAPALDPGVHEINRFRAGDFPLGIAAYAVTNDVEAKLVVEEHTVFVVWPPPADIRLPRRESSHEVRFMVLRNLGPATGERGSFDPTTC